MRPSRICFGLIFPALLLVFPVSPTPARAGEILLSGSSMLAPLEGVWAAAYEKAHPESTVQVQNPGSGAGIRNASGGRATIGASDLLLTSREEKKDGGLAQVPVALSAVVVAAHLPSLPPGSVLRLDGPLLARLFAGKISFWDDPALREANPSLALPHLPVRIVRRADASGTTFLFTSYLARFSRLWREEVGAEPLPSWPGIPGALNVAGSKALRKALLATPGAVGYVGLSWAKGTALLRASLKNDKGQYVPAGTKTVRRAAKRLGDRPGFPDDFARSLIGGGPFGGYPLAGVEFWTVSPDLPEETMRDVRALLLFVLTRGQDPSLTVASGFAPLPDLPGTHRLRQVLREILPGNDFRPSTGG